MTDAPAHPAAAAAAAWHLAGSLAALKAAVDAHWPGRDKRSDGGIGDAAHQAEGSASDHNPWLNNTVRAYDFTATQAAAGIHGVDGDWLAEQLRLDGLAGDPRLTDGGYVIWRGHITAPDFTRWVAYTGKDAHTTHVHVSVSRNPAGYEYAGPWKFLSSAPLHPPTPEPVHHLEPQHPAPAGQPAVIAGPHQGNTARHAPAPLADPDGPEAGFPPPGADATGIGPSFRAQFGNRGPRVAALQEALNKSFADYSHLEADGDYGPETQAVLEDFQRRAAEDPGLPAGTRSALAAGNGDTVGPATAVALLHYGIHL